MDMNAGISNMLAIDDRIYEYLRGGIIMAILLRQSLLDTCSNHQIHATIEHLEIYD